MRQLLTPIEQTASLCGMVYLPPFVVHGTFGLSDEGISRHAAVYRRTIEALRDGGIDPGDVETLERLNVDADTGTGG
jgi:glutathione-regulated potassium-efflux system ancillary protein KefG